MRKLESLLVGAALSLFGCGGDSVTEMDQVVCTTELRPGIMISVLDNATGAAASCGAQALITGTGYSETVANPAVAGCSDTLLLSGAAERPGLYTVTVSKPGYRNAVFADVAVASDVCHVVTVTLTARLITLL